MRGSTSKILLLVLFFAVLTSLSFTQQQVKIGIVNPMEVLEKSVEGKKIIAQLDQKNKSNQERLNKLDDDIRQKETKLSTQRLTLTDEALLNLTSDIERKRTERKRFTEDSSREFIELRNRLFQKLQNELIPIIEQLGKEKNLEVIFDVTKSGVIWISPSIDLTAEVIKRYDAAKASKK